MRSEHLPPGARVSDMFTGTELATVDDLHSFGGVELAPLHGMSLLVESHVEDLDTPGVSS